MTDASSEFVIQLLREKGPLPEGVAINTYPYLDNGHIDSLAFIKFVFRIEEHFNIRFSEADLVGKRIRSVDGMVELIDEKLGESRKS